jgi:hypothetical protein
MRLGCVLGVEDELEDAAAVANVDEGEAAEVAAAVYPAGDAKLLADTVGAQLARPVGPVAVLARGLQRFEASSARNGLCALSAPRLVTPMWPG